jgi:hypothetical protein
MVLWLWSFSYGYDASTMVLQPDAARLRGSVMGWCLFKLAEMCIEAITVKCSVEINSWVFQIGLQLNSERYHDGIGHVQLFVKDAEAVCILECLNYEWPWL